MTEQNEKTGVEALDAEGATLKAHFARVMWVHGPMIYTLAVRLTGNSTDGQDLAQETFVKAYANHSQFRAESTLGTWLYRICVNTWKNRVRSEKRRFAWFHLPWGKKTEDDTGFLEVAAGDPHLSANLEGMDEAQIVKMALAQLTAPERALIVMRDMDGKTYEDICEMLEVPIGTVKSRIARTREKLRILLQPLVKRDL